MLIDLVSSDYRTLRAGLATWCLVNSFARDPQEGDSPEQLAQSAVDATDCLLDKLGVVDPDTVPC
jgi:hypothetical protein